MNQKIIAQAAVSILEELYPEAVCSLTYDKSKPWQLLFAARLSAQCTDARVNKVTPKLFAEFPSLEAFADADVADIEAIIKPCGLYKTKARSIKDAAIKLIADFGGELPETLEDLLTLQGIGRKTANLIMGDIHGKPAIVTDTHFMRITKRLGLTESTSPHAIEKDLVKLIPPEKSSDFCHRLVLFGREYCTAKNPKCSDCPIKQCSYARALIEDSKIFNGMTLK
ncbi:MAG: endonuclease III [Oscillospiraceae bacterium]|nr:endonuclease III [Oscillospiraceae bacterium]